MKPRTCGNCIHCESERNPETGRNCKLAAKCIYPVEWPTLPISFPVNAWNGESSWPRRSRVWQDTDASECPCFQSRLSKPKAKDTPLLIQEGEE